MANTIPKQFFIDEKNELQVVEAADKPLKKREILEELVNELGEDFQEKDFLVSHQRIVSGYYKDGINEYYLIIANTTFMGGKEGKHPKDLKRIQYTNKWVDQYNEKTKEGKIVFWIGIYKYHDAITWSIIDPYTYVNKKRKHKTENYRCSCHIHMNYLYQANLNGIFEINDKLNNTIISAKQGNLKSCIIDGIKPSTDKKLISDICKLTNSYSDRFREWIRADEAIKYMFELKTKNGFPHWMQNLWNGWYIEALYSNYLTDHPANSMIYLGTCNNKEIKEKHKGCGLDLLLKGDTEFYGDLKAICSGYGSTLLNDESAVEEAINNKHRIWFIIYIHDKKAGKTNNHEMVKWRNHFKYDNGEWGEEKFNELSAKNTPHSVKYNKLVIIELNEITKDIYFKIKKQYGNNSNGKKRPDKYSISKKTINEITDDRCLIYRCDI